MKKRVRAHELQKGDIIYFYNNRNRSVKTREVKELIIPEKFNPIEIIDTNNDEVWIVWNELLTVDRKAE
jgi:hypothetical protein